MSVNSVHNKLNRHVIYCRQSKCVRNELPNFYVGQNVGQVQKR
jgi:hypothetical protein